MVLLVAAAGGYVLLPAGTLRDGAFAALGLACVLTAFAGLHRNAPRQQTGWLLVVTGFLGWVLGDALFSLQGALGVEAYPSQGVNAGFQRIPARFTPGQRIGAPVDL